MTDTDLYDRRELILARLHAVLQGLEDFSPRNVYRNKAEVSDRSEPMILMFDGDEEEADETASQRGNRAGASAYVMSMAPELYILLGSTPENVGTELNALRAKVLKAVLTDGQLKTLAGPNGSVRLVGCAFGLHKAKKVEGELGITLAIKYPFQATQV